MEHAQPWLQTGELDVERAGGEPFAAAIRASRVSMILADPRLPDSPIVFANDAFLRLTGYSREDVLGKNARFLQGSQTDATAVAKVRQAVDQRRHIDIELLNYRKDGSTFWNALNISPVFNEAGEIRYFFATHIDVSGHAQDKARLIDEKDKFATEREKRTAELEEALTAKTLLLHEVDHRVKNNLQMISSLILLQSRRIDDPAIRRSLASIQERVEALSLVHRRLYQAEDVSRFDVGEFARELTSELVAMTGRSDIAIDCRVETIIVPADKAAPIALVLNELLVNALRHAFTPGRAGTIQVTLTREGDNLVLEVTDDGVGLVEAPAASNSFGRTLVEALARQMRGSIAWHEQNPGTRVHLLVPLQVRQ